MTATKAKISQHSAIVKRSIFITSVCIISTLLLVSIVINMCSLVPVSVVSSQIGSCCSLQCCHELQSAKLLQLNTF